MSGFFTRERFGEPQALAGLLLLVFLAECVWLAGRTIRASGAVDFGEAFRIKEGLRQWHGERIAGTSYPLLERQEQQNKDANLNSVYLENNNGYDAYHSPLYYLIASAPLLLRSDSFQADNELYWGWLARAPYLVFGVLLGASLWYVSRRLYGNAGGYIALMLYSFSPGMIRNSAIWFTQPEIGAAWGAFGAIFTAIAVAHTLYAPREVVMWNWRRILLLGLSLALAIGSQFSLIIVIPLALAFMLYLAPDRRGAAVAIWTVACGIGFVLIFASYCFRPDAFWKGLCHATFLGLTWKVFGMTTTYQQLLARVGQMSPALVLATPAALVAYLLWPRARYFGNTAPLLLAALFLVLGLATPHYPGLGFQFVAVPFLFVFVAGLAADLLETRSRNLVMACLWGLLGANALWSLIQLARVPQA